jgi:hypothetical protein
MKRSVLLLSNLLLSSTLFWGAPMAQGEEIGSETLKVSAVSATYCHMQFPAMLEDRLFWSRPVLNAGSTDSIDFW